MITTKLLNAALEIAGEAKTNSSDFFIKYAANLRATGETQAEYALYEIELSDDYYVVVDFADNLLENFSFVSRDHEPHISYNIGEGAE